MSPPNWPKLAESRDSAPTEQKMTHSTPENQIKNVYGVTPHYNTNSNKPIQVGILWYFEVRIFGEHQYHLKW